MATLKELSRRTLEDVRHGRHREAYALFILGVALVIPGLIGVASSYWVARFDAMCETARPALSPAPTGGADAPRYQPPPQS